MFLKVKNFVLSQLLLSSHLYNNFLLSLVNMANPDSVYSVETDFLGKTILAHILQESFAHGVLLLDTLSSLVPRLTIGLYAGLGKLIRECYHLHYLIF